MTSANSGDSPGAPSAAKMNADEGKLLGIVRELMQADIKFDPNDRESVHKVVEAIFAARSRKGHVEAERAAPTTSREPAAETSPRSITRSEEGRISGNKGVKIENSLKAKPVADKFRTETLVGQLKQDQNRGHNKCEVQSKQVRVMLLRNLASQADALREDVNTLNYMLELARSFDAGQAMGTGAEAKAGPATSAKGNCHRVLDQLATTRKVVDQRRESSKQKQWGGSSPLLAAQQSRGHVQAPIPAEMRGGPLEPERHCRGKASATANHASEAEKLVRIPIRTNVASLQRSLSGAAAIKEARLATRRYSRGKVQRSQQGTSGVKIQKQSNKGIRRIPNTNIVASDLDKALRVPTYSLGQTRKPGQNALMPGVNDTRRTAPYTVFPQYPPGYKSTIPVSMNPGTLGTMNQVPQVVTQTQLPVSQHHQVQAALQQRLTGLGAHHPGGQGIPQGTQALQHVMETPRHQYQHPLQMHALQMQQHMHQQRSQQLQQHLQQQRSQQMQQQMQQQRSQQMQQQMQQQRSQQMQQQMQQQQQQTLTYETLINMVESAVRSQMEKKPS